MKFEQLKLLPELLQSASAAGYKTATPIQKECIPAILKGRDVLASAQTGTGKTAAFIFPLLQTIATKKHSTVKNYHADILILAPTRELAIQVYEEACFLCACLGQSAHFKRTGVFRSPREGVLCLGGLMRHRVTVIVS